jgi:SAM-dependent methyltransferase
VAGYNPEDYSTPEWFKGMAWQHPWIEFMAGWWVGEFGKPESVLDFGCGDGWWLKAFHSMTEVVTCGVELHPIANEYVPEGIQLFIHDLREPLWLGKKADLVICLEVAEHLPKEDADTLCRTIIKHLDGHLLFSAAGPGQTGTGHVTLEPQSYWIERIERLGKIKFSQPKTGRTRRAFENILNETYGFLPRNIMVFSRIG